MKVSEWLSEMSKVVSEIVSKKETECEGSKGMRQQTSKR